MLRASGLFESDEASLNREEVLGRLNEILQEWIKDVTARRLSPELAQDACVKLFTFGSYRLGVHTPGSDVDTLCIGARHVSRDEDFFGRGAAEPGLSMYERLQREPAVETVVAVPDAVVPEIKMVFSGVEIDLAFVPLSADVVPEDLDVMQTSLLRNLDDPSVKSMNGVRVATNLCQLVPNVENYRAALRCIKLWCSRRGLNSNVLGFLGGVNMAILVARVCQLYPNAIPPTLVTKFFNLWDMWKWPSPVMLTEIVDEGLGHRVWDPRINPSDKRDLMPIITPSYPCQNSMYNVGPSTLKIMKDEFKRGVGVCGRVIQGTATWDELFEPLQFFKLYKHYLQITVKAENGEDFKKWQGFVHSRLRKLVEQVEYSTHSLLMLHPHTEKVEDPDHDAATFCCYFMGVKKQKNLTGVAQTVDLNAPVDIFRRIVFDWRERPEGADVLVSYMKRKDLPYFTDPEKAEERRAALAKEREAAGNGTKEGEGGEGEGVGKEGEGAANGAANGAGPEANGGASGAEGKAEGPPAEANGNKGVSTSTDPKEEEGSKKRPREASEPAPEPPKKRSYAEAAKAAAAVNGGGADPA